MIREVKFQIGRNGITEGVIISLNTTLKTHNQIRISILKSSGRNKENIQQMAEEIISKINYKCYYRILGFTIILKRQSGKQKNTAAK